MSKIYRDMSKLEIMEFSNKILEVVVLKYGFSKHYEFTPYLQFEDFPFSDSKVLTNVGEFCFMENEITIFWKLVNDKEELIRTIIHEYQHYLQSPHWFTRYYNEGHDYESHPYEIAALKEEECWEAIYKSIIL